MTFVAVGARRPAQPSEAERSVAQRSKVPFGADLEQFARLRLFSVTGLGLCKR
jgi:hypothetical protein